jgi:hypothetical protein
MGRADVLALVVGKRYWHEAEAKVVVAAWRESGTSLAAFARERGVDAARVARWSARLRAASEQVRFHPVRVMDAGHSAGRPDLMELVLVDGTRVRVPAGFAAADLGRLLDVLEERKRC